MATYDLLIQLMRLSKATWSEFRYRSFLGAGLGVRHLPTDAYSSTEDVGDQTWLLAGS